MTRLGAAAIAVFLLSFCNLTAGETYKFDKDHTSIVWFGNHFGYSDSVGFFHDFEGSFTLDEEKPENSSVEVTIKADSLVSGIAPFNKHLKSKDFLNVEEFPEIVFKSTKVELLSESEAKIHGELTLLGNTKEIVLQAKKNKIAPNPWHDKKTAGFSVSGRFDRSDFGMDWGLPGVADEVKILIEAEGIKQE